MTTLTDNKLIIAMPSTESNNYRNDLIKAIAATIRWRANYKEQRTGDEQSLEVISDLLESLAKIDNA